MVIDEGVDLELAKSHIRLECSVAFCPLFSLPCLLAFCTPDFGGYAVWQQDSSLIQRRHHGSRVKFPHGINSRLIDDSCGEYWTGIHIFTVWETGTEMV